MLAGDSDTNCAIVGGLIGAYVGVSKLDKEKLKKVLECDISLGNQPRRPDYCQPSKGGFEEMQKLLKMAPTSLKVVDEISK